jgi:hypothetical protein
MFKTAHWSRVIFDRLDDLERSDVGRASNQGKTASTASPALDEPRALQAKNDLVQKVGRYPFSLGDRLPLQTGAELGLSKGDHDLEGITALGCDVHRAYVLKKAGNLTCGPA